MISMNDVRLAQLFEVKSVDVSKLQKIDVAYCVKGDPSMRIASSYAGYNCLHFAAKKSNSHSIKVLLDKGADLLQQSLEDGATPLHVAYYSAFPEPFNMSSADKANQKLVINTLLSMQVEKNLGENPKCKEGLSHCHIACIVNHVAALHLFLKNGVCLNDKINSDSHVFPGFTALHFAVEYSSVEAAEVLLKNGSNIHMRDSNGLSPLDLLIKRLLYLTDFVHIGKRRLCCLIMKEIKKLQIMAQSFLTYQVNYTDNPGLSTLLHLACLSVSSIATTLLKNSFLISLKMSKDSVMWPEWDLLHFAACCSTTNFKILVQKGADMNAKNLKGETPLDFFMMRFGPEEIYSVLNAKEEMRNVLLSDGVSKLLDLLLAMKDHNTLRDFLHKKKENITVPHNSKVWAGCNVLHLTTKMNERTVADGEFLKDCENKLDLLPEIYNCAKEDEEVYLKRIKTCLENLYSVKTENVDGFTPIHLAFNLGKQEVVSLLLNNCKENIADSNNISVLHIACAVGEMNVAMRLIENGAEINSKTSSSFKFPIDKSGKTYLLPVRANSTPLHVSVIFGHKDLAMYLQTIGADVYAQDSFGLTPIHLSMAEINNCSANISRGLLSKIRNLKESVSNGGLSHLHVVAFADMGSFVKKLIEQKADINAIFDPAHQCLPGENNSASEVPYLSNYSNMTPLYIALTRYSKSAVHALLKYDADIFTENPRTKSILAMVVDSLNFIHFIAEKLKKNDRVLTAMDHSGVTLLHVACAAVDLDWGIDLLKRGAQTNVQMQSCYDEHDMMGDTPLQLLVSEAEALQVPLPDGLLDFVNVLLENGADVTIQSNHKSALALALCADKQPDAISTYYIVPDLLLKSQKSYAVNPVDENGFSHLHYACSRNALDIVKKFLHNGVDVNQSTDPFYTGFTPLHVAFHHRSLSVARLLIQKGADLKAESTCGETPLHIALSKIEDLEIFELMLSNGADINAKSPFGSMRPIDCLVRYNKITKELLEFCLNKGCKLELSDNGYSTNTMGLIVKNTKPIHRQAVISKLIDTCGLRMPVKNGFNAISSIVAVDQMGTLDQVFYFRIIEMFMNMGYEIDQQNKEGKTALHEAVRRFNSEAIEALLLLGARMDIADNRAMFPFTASSVKICNVRNKRHALAFDILAWYVVKMKSVGMKVHKSLETAVFATINKFRINPSVFFEAEEFISELAKLKKFVFVESLGTIDFLHPPRAVTEYPTMSFAERLTLQEFFKNPKNVQQQFPLYSGILLMQYRKALKRMELYQSAKTALAVALQVWLPNICSENILKYFENEELIKFINDYATQF